jgi:single-stranded DNA-binding protein
MAHGHRVYFLGTLTRNPEVRAAPNGMVVARYGVAVPTRRRPGDTWHPDVCRIEVVAFGLQAATVGAAQRPRRPDRGAFTVAALGAGRAVPPHP